MLVNIIWNTFDGEFFDEFGRDRTPRECNLPTCLEVYDDELDNLEKLMNKLSDEYGYLVEEIFTGVEYRKITFHDTTDSSQVQYPKLYIVRASMGMCDYISGKIIDHLKKIDMDNIDMDDVVQKVCIDYQVEYGFYDMVSVYEYTPIIATEVYHPTNEDVIRKQVQL